MYKHLSASDKIRIIQRVLKAGEGIARVSREEGISRTVVYQWIKAYRSANSRGKIGVLTAKNTTGSKHWKTLKVKDENSIIKFAITHASFSPHTISLHVGYSIHGVWNVLKRNGLNTIKAREEYVRVHGSSLIKSVVAADKLSVIRRVERGEKAAVVCRHLGISRGVYYKWLKRYKMWGRDIKSLDSFRPKGETHWRYVDGARENVLELVVRHPELSSQKLAQLLNEENGRKIIGSHGVYTILLQLDLNTYQKRLAYAIS